LPGEAGANAGGAARGSDQSPKAGAAKRPAADVNRAWTNVRGQSTTATFVRMFGRNVVLARSSKVLTVPYDGLSAGDQQFLKDLLTERGLEAQIPPALQQQDGSAPVASAPQFDPNAARQRNLDDLNQRAEEARQRAAEARQLAEEARNRASEQAEQSRQQYAEQTAEENRQAAEHRQQLLADQEAARQQREQERTARMEQQRAEREAMIANQPVGKCSNCQHDITRNESQGTNCPYCNTVWTYKEDQFGRKKYTGAVDANVMAKGVGVLAVVGAVVVGGFGIFIAIIVAIVRSIANAGKVNRRREIY
jgi:rubrerythrin